jgi:hypothetical protein
MKSIFVIWVAFTASLFVNPGTPRADTSACILFTENQKMMLKGTIVLTATGRDDDSGKLDPAMAIVLESPTCLATDSSSKSDFIAIYSRNGSASVSHYRRWLGHDVTITGKMEGVEEGASGLPYAFDVESIKDTDDISGNAPVSLDPDKVNDPKLAAVSCRWVLRPDRGTDDSITEHAVDHLEAFRDSGKLPGKYFWCACTMYEYVLAECRESPRATVLDAVNNLISKTKAGKALPSIPRCGA